LIHFYKRGYRMPGMKLTYFNLRARAEPARLILAQAGQDYEDARLPAPWDDMAPWQELKPNTPFGQLPVLNVNGVEIAQSMTVARYVAREFGLAGTNNLESALMDAIVDAVSEATEKMYNAYVFEKDEAKKAELTKKFNEDVLPSLLKNIEKGLKDDYLVGGTVSWADIILYHFVKELPSQDALKDAPKVAGVVERVANLPNIKKWVETRPQTKL